MPDLVLQQRSPLAGIAPGQYGNVSAAPGVLLAEVTGRGLASVIARKGQAAVLAQAARSAFGVDLPVTPRRVAGERLSFVWAGPEQWLAMFEAAPQGGPEALLAPLVGLASIVDQSDSRAIVSVGGGCARAALAKGVPVDLHERAFKPGDVALTLAGHVNVHLWQVDWAPTYEIAVARSLAGSFWRWLTQSAAEFGYEVTRPSDADKPARPAR